MFDLAVKGGTVVDGTGAPSRPADVGVREPELLDEPVQRARLFDRVQVLALDVFDECDGHGRFVGNVAHDGRDRLQAGH